MSDHLERLADDILRDDRRRARANGEGDNALHGILLEEQLQVRYEHEVFTSRGNIDQVARRGIYKRAWGGIRRRPTWRDRQTLWADPWRQQTYEENLG